MVRHLSLPPSRFLDDFSWRVRPLDSYPILGDFVNGRNGDVLFGYNFTGEWQDDRKYLVAGLARADCSTPVSTDLFHLKDPWHEEQEYFVSIQVDLDGRNLAPEYRQLDDTTSMVEFCVRVDYMSRINASILQEESINFHETIVRLTFEWWKPEEDSYENNESSVTTTKLARVELEIQEPREILVANNSSFEQPPDCDELDQDGAFNFIHVQACRLNNISADTKAVAMALTPKFTAALSGLASVLLIAYFVQRNKDDTITSDQLTFNGMILGGCVAHFVASIAWFATTWPIPPSNKESEYAWFWNIGNETSCRVQGAMAEWSVGTIVYTTAGTILLAMPHKIKLVRNWIHVLAWTVTLAVCGVALGLDLVLAQEWMCWIGQPFEACAPEADEECASERLLRYVLRDGIVWILFLVSGGVLIWCEFFHRHALLDTSSDRGGDQVNPTRNGSNSSLGCTISLSTTLHPSLKPMRGAFLSMFVCWVPFLLIQLYQDVAGSSANFWLRLMAYTVLPCQGLIVLVMVGVNSIRKTLLIDQSVPVSVSVTDPKTCTKETSDEKHSKEVVIDTDEEGGDAVKMEDQQIQANNSDRSKEREAQPPATRNDTKACDEQQDDKENEGTSSPCELGGDLTIHEGRDKDSAKEETCEKDSHPAESTQT